MAMPLQSVLHPFFLPALFVSQFDTLEIQLNGKLGSNTDGDSEGIAYAHLLWSIPGGSSSSCFCCDFLLDQDHWLIPLARYPSSFSVSFYSFFLFSLSFFPYSFLLFGPPHLIHPPIRNCILSGRRHGARGARTAASSCCFCCCPLVQFFSFIFLCCIPL